MRPLNVTGRRWAPACTNTAIETGRLLNGAAKGVRVRRVTLPALMAGQTLTETLGLYLKDACVSSPDQARGAGANDGFTVLSGFRRRRVSGSPWSSRPRADGVIAARSAAEIRVLPRQYSSARNAVSVVAGDAA